MRSLMKRFRLAITFIKFLHERCAFRYFMDNFMRSPHHAKGMSLFDYLTFVPSDMFVSAAFKFDKTRQGFDYWMNVDIKWNDFLTKNFDKL